MCISAINNMFSPSCCYQDCFSLSSVFITLSVVLLLYCYLFLWIYIWNLLSLLIRDIYCFLCFFLTLRFSSVISLSVVPSRFTYCKRWQHKCEIFCTCSLFPLPESLTFVLLSLLLLISCSEYVHSFSTDEFTHSFLCSYIS